jgi:hypothetical protein
MGAAAVSTRTKRARPATKPRRAAKPRPAAKPRTASKTPAVKARSTAASGSRARTKAATRPRAAATSRARSPRGSAAVAARAMPSTGLRALTPVVAVGRTAVAVGGLADCGVVMGLTRSRAWIVVLGVLLGGIVALNVWGLSLNAASSATAAKIDQLERENSVLQARKSTKLSNDKIETAAAQLGLAVPAADAIQYLKAGDNDINRAAKRLAEGAISAVATAVTPTDVVDPAIDPVTGAPVDPLVDPALAAPTTDTAVTAPTDPAATDTVTDTTATTTTDPATTEPVTPDPATTDPVATDTAATTTPATDPATGAVAP